MFLKRAYLDDYELVFDKVPDAAEGAVANIRSLEGSRVWGGLFVVEDREVAGLDEYEDYPRFCEKMIVKVKDEQGFVYDALCYHRRKRIKGIPQGEYLSAVIQGARDCKLPEEYIQKTFPKTSVNG